MTGTAWITIFPLLLLLASDAYASRKQITISINSDVPTGYARQITAVAAERGFVHTLAKVNSCAENAKAMKNMADDELFIYISRAPHDGCTSDGARGTVGFFLFDQAVSSAPSEFKMIVRMDNEPNWKPQDVRETDEIDSTVRKAIDKFLDESTDKYVEEKRHDDKDETRVCLPIPVVVILGIILAVLIALIVFLCMRNKKEKKAVIDSIKTTETKSTVETPKSRRFDGSETNKSEKGQLSRESSTRDSKPKGPRPKGVPGSAETTEPISVTAGASKEMTPQQDLKEMLLADPLLKPVSLPERAMAARIDEPITAEEFIEHMKRATAFVVDYHRNPTQWPVSTGIKPYDIFKILPRTAPDNPETFESVLKDFRDVICNGMVMWHHPRFHAFFVCGRSYPDIMAETIISCLGTVGFSWAANPAITELELTVMNWMGTAFGLPQSFLFQGEECMNSPGGGYIADSASDAIFCAVMAARNKKIVEELAACKEVMKEEGEDSERVSRNYAMKAEICQRLVAYGSCEAHSSFEKACKMAMVRCRSIKTKEENDWGMTREDLENAMKKDKARGLLPFFVHVAVGTTSTATSDHLQDIGPLGTKEGVWLHVDAAYAGSAWIDPKYRANQRGIEMADSLNINMHKFFLASTSATLFWTRHQRAYKESFVVNPVYLNNKDCGIDLRHWGVQLSRRFKSLKVWFILRMYGIAGLRSYVNKMIEGTHTLESLILPHPNLKKFGKTNLGIFCFQYCEPNLNKNEINDCTRRLCQFINESRQLMFTHSSVQGNDIIRVTVTWEGFTRLDLEESANILKTLVEEFKRRKDEPNLLQTSIFKRLPGHKQRMLPHDMDHDMAGSPVCTLDNSLKSENSLTDVNPEKMRSLLAVDANVLNELLNIRTAASPTPVSPHSAPAISPPDRLWYNVGQSPAAVSPKQQDKSVTQMKPLSPSIPVDLQVPSLISPGTTPIKAQSPAIRSLFGTTGAQQPPSQLSQPSQVAESPANGSQRLPPPPGKDQQRQ